MSKILTEAEMQKAQLLLDFIKITKDGMTKPYDPTAYLRKLEDFGSAQAGELRNCCPPSAEVKDAKDFKPYIEGALEEFAKIMGLEVRKNNNNYGNRRSY